MEEKNKSFIQDLFLHSSGSSLCSVSQVIVMKQSFCKDICTCPKALFLQRIICTSQVLQLEGKYCYWTKSADVGTKLSLEHLLSKSPLITTSHVPVKGGRCLWLPLHVESVEVDVVKSSSYPIFPVPLEAVHQRPGCVSNYIHSIYDNRCVPKVDRCTGQSEDTA